ncbi:putative phytosulfokines 4 [Mangifera indica]|uniref:putative phytosulfokines 4 n=1 Tax=Mangifera indica TaxID=29780 RepID=UPI001CFA2274|nr:putative phytosulfokines 4 [Mangifera indica]
MAKVKVGTLFMVLLLVLFSTLIHAARPEPAFPNHSPTKTQLVDVAGDDCQGGSDEECLMRRTLVAHTDYIYTQKQHP